jgi:uncharacterized protein YndB with AHSA1/START domain
MNSMETTLEVTRSIVVAASRETVWAAITTPEQISQWFEKTEFARLAVGEPMRFTEYPQHFMEITVVEPMARFGFRGQPAPPNLVMTEVVFTLEAVAGGTRVTVTESGFEALPDSLRTTLYEGNTEGWRIKMGALAAYLGAP